MTDSQRNKLLHAVTQYDIKQSKKKFYNHYALGHYLIAIDAARTLMEGGKHTIREALVEHFNGRLLDVCLKAVGEAKATDDEQRF